MAAGDTTITMIGNLVDDPELRFTPSGAAVAKFRVASTPRYLDKATNEWKDGESLFLQCQIWRQAAENVAESLTKGMRVILSGRLKQRSYETKEGEKRTVFEVEVDEVGPSLRSATAKVTRAQRAAGANSGFSAPAAEALMTILGLHQPQHHLLAAGQPPLAMNLRFKPTYPSIPSSF
jgi:single-strand DNA-binding protein